MMSIHISNIDAGMRCFTQLLITVSYALTFVLIFCKFQGEFCI
jgi:hypothetical protein